MVYTCETLYNQQDEGIGAYNGDWFNHQDDSFDIDTPISSIEAKMSRRSTTRYPSRPKNTHAGRSAERFQSPKVNMPWERWKQLGNDARTTWDTLDDRDKAVILGSSPLTEHSRFQRDDHQTTQHINMHNLQEQRVDGEHFHDTFQLPMNDGAEVGLTEAFQSQQQPTNKYPPLDIRANMSQKAKANPRDAKMAHVTYTVSSIEARMAELQSRMLKILRRPIERLTFKVYTTTNLLMFLSEPWREWCMPMKAQ
jgi:hypothetical protein